MNTALSVNVNKAALLRNSRGRGIPDLHHITDLCLASGCHGITIHPRRDQRHIRFDDVPRMAHHLSAHHPGVELNVECELHPDLIDLVLKIRPAQCTLVPVTPGEITSDHGWDLQQQTRPLRETILRLKDHGIRTSIFMDVEPGAIAPAAETGTDRVELYTGPYAWAWGTPDQQEQTDRLNACVQEALGAGLEVNAGHDLDRHNCVGLANMNIAEVSIGHALITRSLEVGLPTAISELLIALGYPI